MDQHEAPWEPLCERTWLDQAVRHFCTLLESHDGRVHTCVCGTSWIDDETDS